MIELTNDSDYLLCVLYKFYKDRRKSGMNKSDAKFLGSSEDIFLKLLSEWTYEDVNETFGELRDAQFLDCIYADGKVTHSVLTDTAIIYMENRFKNGLSEIIDNIARLKNIMF